MRMNTTQRKQMDQTILAAIQKNLSAATSLVLLGTTYTPATLEAVFQDDIDEASAAETARAAWLVATKSANAKAAAVSKVRRALQAYATATYGDSDDIRTSWGLPQAKAMSPTVATKAAAQEKAAATRKARGTLGKRQKAKITGSTPAVLPVSPVPAVPAK
jgi:hypothetical protein